MYGSWISKDKIIPVLDYEAHDDIALEIISKWTKRDIQKLGTRKYSAYRILLRLGYIRIKYNRMDDRFIDIANYYPFAKFTKFQQEIINSAAFKDFTHLYSREMDKIMEMNRKENSW